METLRSYVEGRFVVGQGAPAVLVNPATEAPLAETSTSGIDFAAALAYARTRGGPALRELTFAERGELLRALSRLIHQHREALIEPAIANGGNTRSDAKFDIDGAAATLAYYADLGAKLGAARLLVDGEAAPLGRSPRFVGQHLLVPRHGVALHVNAFNFPAWGFAEKAACALLAGTPVVTKPATSTALLAARLVELIVEAKLLPDGALTFLCGGVGDLLSHLTGQDVLAFTGSADTGARLRSAPAVVERSVRVNVEADSLNVAVLAEDVARGTPTWELFVGDVVRDMTQKTGQKCTAIRRVLVPSSRLDEVAEDLAERLSRIRLGDPALPEVTMGPLATAQQQRDVQAGMAKLRAEADPVPLPGGDREVAPLGVAAGRGYFVAPLLLRCTNPDAARAIHEHEVFGPCATLLPYDGASRAADLVARGGGVLVSSLYGDDRAAMTTLALAVAPFAGRVHLGSEKVAAQATPPGLVLPQLIHGGPGRAGGGEELGGVRGLSLYLQRVAFQGDKPLVEALSAPTAATGSASAS